MRYFYFRPSSTSQTNKEKNEFFGAEQERSFFKSEEHSGDQGAFFSTPPPTLQTKPAFGSSKDIQEKEAESMTDAVVGSNSVQRKPVFESEEEQNQPKVQRKCATCEEEEKLQKKELEPEEEEAKVMRKSGGSAPADTNNLQNQLNTSKGEGIPLSEDTKTMMESAFDADFGGVKVHTNSGAAEMNKSLNAQAFTHGSDIYFDKGKYNTGSTSGKYLLAHELAHIVQQKGIRSPTVQRHPVAPTLVARKTKTDLFGDGTPANTGITLREFKSYTDQQADWFTEPTLTSADRVALWKLLFKADRGLPFLSGVGDVKINNLRVVTDPQWDKLETYSRGADSRHNTVQISPSGPVADRIALGGTLKDLESIFVPEVLKVTVAQADLQQVHNDSLIFPLRMYKLIFAPHLQQTIASAEGGKSEFQKMLDLLKGPGIFPFITLVGKVRNLHRFSPKALQKLVVNYLDFSRSKPLYLVLHTGLDHNAGFLKSAHLFENLIQNKSKLVLMLEGQGSLGDITSQIPTLASTYGQPDASGTPKIAQVMIAGHGSSQSVALAGSGTPSVNSQGEVEYSGVDRMDISNPAQRAKTQALLETLMDNMDPATARIVYAGCLVGATSVPLKDSSGSPMSAAGISSHLADPANQNMVSFTQSVAASKGMAGMPVEGARASVGLAGSRSLLDSSGNLSIDYTYDPTAFGNAVTYVATGHEPEGVMRAAVEVAATNPVVAANQLRVRSALAITTPWYDDVTLKFVEEALDGVAVGAGVDVVKVNKLAHMADTFFLSYWGSKAVGHFGGHVNIHGALALSMYAKIVSIPAMNVPTALKTKKGRFILEQGWTILDPTRAPQLISYLDATAALTPNQLSTPLNIPWLNHGAASTVLFPSGSAASNGRIRLAIAWIFKDRTNADVRNFLDNQVDTSGSRPRLKAGVIAQLDNPADEDRILEILNRLTPSVPASGGGPALDPANADVFPNAGAPMNEVRIEPRPYEAVVIPPAYVLNVRTQPSMRGTPFHWLKRGEKVQVMGFTHNWAALDINGRLGFAFKNFLSPPL